jgi:ABC-type glycerol-3-phosphate transport system permease component
MTMLAVGWPSRWSVIWPKRDMTKARTLLIMRDAAAISIVGLFLFPIFWWGLNSIKPVSALFDKDRIVFFDFEPSFINYWVTF